MIHSDNRAWTITVLAATWCTGAHLRRRHNHAAARFSLPWEWKRHFVGRSVSFLNAWEDFFATRGSLSQRNGSRMVWMEDGVFLFSFPTTRYFHLGQQLFPLLLASWSLVCSLYQGLCTIATTSCLTNRSVCQLFLIEDWFSAGGHFVRERLFNGTSIEGKWQK